MTKKKDPIEELARIVKSGFDKTATKQDLEKLVTKDELNKLRIEMHEGFSFLNQAIQNLDVRISSYATEKINFYRFLKFISLDEVGKFEYRIL